MNLRGLGAGATLTLINGRRVAQAGERGGYTDVSSIPTSAIERIEVLADGASSVYGSDAVGGVVNVILKNDFEGAETRLRFGTVTEGGLREYQASQSMGASWNTGNILLSYEYYDRGNLAREERAFARSSDLRPFGGDDFRTNFSVPGNITNFVENFAIPDGQDGRNLSPDDLLAGEENLFDNNEGRDLLRAQQRHSVFLRTSQSVSDSLELFAEGWYNQRQFEGQQGGANLFLSVPGANPFFVDPFGSSNTIFVRYNSLADFGPSLVSGAAEDFSAVMGAEAELGRGWQLRTFSSYSERQTEDTAVGVDSAALNEALGRSDAASAFNPFGVGSSNSAQLVDSLRLTRTASFVSDVWLSNIIINGPLLTLPAGDLRLAVGAEYYQSSLESRPNLQTRNKFSRDVAAFFAEAFVPIFGPANRRLGFEELIVSGSVRYEDYNDVGETVNPKIGLTWTPFDGLDLRASYGTSFRAPGLRDLDETNNVNRIFGLPDSSSSAGATLSLLQIGNNADLGNETADIWTVGAAFSPNGIPGISFDIGYYNIQYKDRIATALDSLFSILNDDQRFATAIVRSPDASQIAAVCNSGVPLFGVDIDTCLNSPIEALVDLRLINTAETRTDGLDFILSYSSETAGYGSIAAGLNGTYILSFEEAFGPTAQVTELVGAVGEPTDLFVRGWVTWQNNKGLSATVFVNHRNAYEDNVSSPVREIDSWTTSDLTLSYDAGQSFSRAFLQDLVFSLSIQNLFDEDPPFVNNASGVGYDPENANPLGRFVSLNLRKSW